MTDDINLPPLPRGDVYVRGSTTGQPMWAFSEIQLLAFARAAVLADREQRAVKTCQHCYDEGVRHANDAIDEQRAEPVAYSIAYSDNDTSLHRKFRLREDAEDYVRQAGGTARVVPLYTAPQPAEQKTCQHCYDEGVRHANDAIDEQRAEPVAWRMRNTSFRRVVYEHFPSREDAERRLKHFNMSCDDGMLCDLTPLYAAPQPVKRKPLTDEQIEAAISADKDALLDLIYELGTTAEGIQRRFRKIARAIERAHGIGGKT